MSLYHHLVSLLEGGFDGFYDWVLEFSGALDIPKKMSVLGVDKAQLELLAKMAVEDPSASGNPIPLTVDITRKLYEELI